MTEPGSHHAETFDGIAESSNKTPADTAVVQIARSDVARSIASADRLRPSASPSVCGAPPVNQLPRSFAGRAFSPESPQDGGTVRRGVGEAGAEIVAYDEKSARTFVTNAATDRVDVVDVRDGTKLGNSIRADHPTATTC